MHKWIILALVLVNLWDFILMGVDKYKARRGLWRIRERTFFLIALLGGSVGAILGMFCFHHNTRLCYFRYGLPAFLVLQAGLWFWRAH